MILKKVSQEFDKSRHSTTKFTFKIYLIFEGTDQIERGINGVGWWGTIAGDIISRDMK